MYDKEDPMERGKVEVQNYHVRLSEIRAIATVRDSSMRRESLCDKEGQREMKLKLVEIQDAMANK